MCTFQCNMHFGWVRLLVSPISLIQPKVVCVLLSTTSVVVVVFFNGTMQFSF